MVIMGPWCINIFDEYVCELISWHAYGSKTGEQKKMVVHLRQPSRLLWSHGAPTCNPSIVESERFSLLCEASLTQCPLL
ncbi:hypothetical protein Hanom_Chr09g00772211 [Helianthus anomalus]